MKEKSLQIHRSTTLDLCSVEVSLQSAVDTLDYLVGAIGEATMFVGTQQAIIMGAQSLVEQAINQLVGVRSKNINAIPDYKEGCDCQE